MRNVDRENQPLIIIRRVRKGVKLPDEIEVLLGRYEEVFVEPKGFPPPRAIGHPSVSLPRALKGRHSKNGSRNYV